MRPRIDGFLRAKTAAAADDAIAAARGDVDPRLV
jgi:hypothetical protein